MKVVDQILGAGEYYTDVVTKKTIYIHHTAGGHRPDWTISGWDSDDTVDKTTGKKKPLAVATAYVIGGLSTSSAEAQFDGVVYRAFDEKLWAHHLGTKYVNNTILNKESIGMEICNYGPLSIGKDGKFYNYVNKPVPAEMVVKLEKPFKGFLHYHKYTDKQIEAIKELILDLKQKFPGIEMKTPLLTVEGFELNEDAKAGKSGIYGHTNVRNDKFDMSPQPNLIAMLKTICK
jgi:hypothetical protein